MVKKKKTTLKTKETTKKLNKKQEEGILFLIATKTKCPNNFTGHF